jgi:ribosomal protein L24E
MLHRRDLAPPLSDAGPATGGARQANRTPSPTRRRLSVLAAAITVAGLVTTFAGAPQSGAIAISRGQPVRRAAGDVKPAARAAPFVPTFGAYLGIDPAFDLGTSQVTQADEVEKDIGRTFGIVSFYTKWIGDDPLTKDLTAVAAQGSLPMVSMNCSYPDAAVAAGDYDAEIEGQAKAYAAYGGPILFRWFWEMNYRDAKDYATCLGPGTVQVQGAAYIAAYKQIWNIFQEEGASNVAFVWAPNANSLARPPILFYPGPEYVNWIGADLNDRPGSGTFAQMFSSFYATWSKCGKPMIVTETGAIGATDQVAWLGSIASSLPSQFPDLHGVVYTDDITDPLGTYYLQPAGAGMAELRAIAHDAYFSEPQSGFAFTTASGSVHTYGTPNYGSLSGALRAPVVGMAEDSNGLGYWLVGADGSIYTFGDAKSYGSMRGQHLNKPIVGMAATTEGTGYWLVASDGGIFSFGGARFYGSTGAIRLNRPIVGMAAAPGGEGYWFVASDGGIFAFGDAKFRGSTGAMRLNSPIVGMAATPDGEGYWLVAADGGIFCFGDAHYLGSLGADKLASRVVGMSEDAVAGRYRVVTGDGAVFEFPGGELSSTPDASPVVAIVSAH